MDENYRLEQWTLEPGRERELDARGCELVVLINGGSGRLEWARGGAALGPDTIGLLRPGATAKARAQEQGLELSLNYLSALLMDAANLPMTGYQKYLLELWQAAPVINTVGVQTADGAWYGENEDLPADLEAAVAGYRMLLYNNIFDKSNRLEEFFSLTE